MKQNRQQSTTISFSLSGIQDILGHQNKLKKSIKDVIKTQKEALKSEQEGTAAYEARVRWIEALEKEYKSFGRQLNSVADTLERLDKASGKALKGAYASLTKGLNAIDFDVTGKALEDATQKAEAYGSALRGVGARIGGLGEGFHDMTKSIKSSKLSYHDMAAFVKIVEQSGHALAASYKNEEKAYSRMGENATKLKVRMAELDGVRTRLSNSMSKEELEQSRRFFGEMSRYKLATDSQSSTYAKKAEQARDLLAGKHLSTLSSPDRYSVKEVEESVKWLQTYQKEVRLSEQSQSSLNNALDIAAKHLKTFNDESRFSAKSDLFGRMSQQMQNIKTISREALSEQQKYWKDVYDKMEHGSGEYKSAAENIRLVNEELARRNKEEALNKGRNLVSQIHSGYQPDSERELEEVRKKLQAYRKELSESETDEIHALQEALHLLNKEVQAGKKLMEDAGKHKGEQNSNDYWKTQVENSKEASKTLEENIKNLKAYRDTLDSAKEDEAVKLKEVNAAIAENERLQRKANTQQYESFKGLELRNKSLVELKEAYEALKKEIEQLSPAQEGYNEKAAQMRDIDAQIKNLTRSTERHANALEVAAKKLRNHILIYLSFDKFTELFKTVVSNTIELSDLMTNVQKVTNLSNEEIKEMSHLLMGIDTRTANQQLFEMAEQAGKLGLATKEGAQGIVEFVRAGEQIVNTLGDIGGAESITELLKINEVANKDRQGIERDLLRIGSAILNVGNNSKAAYGNVSEFTKRMGSTGSVLNLTLPQIMGLGGAYSALGEEVARSATATQRVMMGIVNHPREVAKSLNISYKALDELLQSGKSYEAFLFVLDALNKEGASAWDEFFKAIGGRNNMQARAAISLLSQHISQLEFQVSLAEEGFKDGTLVTSEFEKANNNLAGVVEQVKNELYEMTTAVEESDGYILDFAKLLLKITKWLKESNTEVNRATIFWGLLAAAIVNLINKGIKLGFFNALIANLKTLNSILKQTGGAAMLARSAIQKLKAALITNWATVAIAAIAAIVAIIVKLNNAAAEARKELGKLSQAGEEESRDLTRLYNKMRDVWDMQGERNKRITEFNKKFGEYYGHLLRETSTLNDLEVAYRAVSAAILEKNAAELEGTAMQRGLEGTKEERAEASGAIREAIAKRASVLNRGKGLNTTEIKDLSNEIIHSITNFYEDKSITDKSEDSLYRYLKQIYKNDERLQREFGYDPKTQEHIYNNLLKFDDRVLGAANPLNQAIDSYAKAAQKAAEITSKQLEEAEYIRGRANLGKQSLAESLYESILEKKGYEQYQEIEEYLSTVSQITNTEWKESMRDKTEKVQGIVANLVKNEKPWGIQSPDWSEMGGADLAALVDWFNNVQKGFRSGGTFTSAFGHNPPTGVDLPASINSWDKESIIDWAYTNWQKAKKVLEEYNKASGEGNFKDSDEESERAKMMKNLIEKTLKTLENYYLERQMLAEKYLNEGLVSEDEYNRYIFANEQEHLRERQNLRKKWLDQTIQFETEGVRRLMQEVDFSAINQYIKDEDKGGKMAASYTLENTKDRNAEESARREARKALSTALLDKRPLAKVSDNYTSDLFKLSILGPDKFDAVLHTEQDAQRKMMERLSFLVHEAIEGKGVTADILKDKAKSNPVVSEWLRGLDDQSLMLLVNRTNEFYEEYEDAVSKEVSNLQKRIDFKNKTNGNESRWASMTEEASRHSSIAQMVSSWGMAGIKLNGLTKDDIAQKEELYSAVKVEGEKYANIYAESEQARLKAAKKAADAKAEYEQAKQDPSRQEMDIRQLEEEYLRLEAESLGATTAALTLQAEAWREVEEASLHSITAQQEQIGKSIEQVMPYYENLLSFSEAFGSAIFGKKEDRVNASKELVDSMIKTTGSMLKEWLVYVTTKRFYDKMEEFNEIAKLERLKAIRLMYEADALKQLGDEALVAEKVKEAQNASDAAAAQSKEAAKYGWKGWLIGAGLSLLMTTVFSAASAKATSLISSATGATASGGKLSTNMLTYASGRYPVYAEGASSGDMVNVTGADGARYRARYQPHLRTGVVRTPHLGIVGESGAEVIIDNPTYNNLRRYRPDVLNAIYSMRQMGTRSLDLEGARQRGNAVLMRRAGVSTYADGNVGSMSVSTAVPTIGSDLSAVLSRLDATLSDLKGGIPAYMNMYGTGGGAESMEKADKFLRRVGKRR